MHIPPTRRFIALILIASAALALTFVSLFRGLPADPQAALHGAPPDDALGLPLHLRPGAAESSAAVAEHTLTGAPTAPALGNETAKAELGRAAWTLLHTTFARFPDAPGADEQAALRAFVYLFARLYPCGECARHFAGVLERFPPQVSTRSAAATWGCHVHNEVNKKLGKPDFDCSKIGDFYKCGCADDESDGKNNGGKT